MPQVEALKVGGSNAPAPLGIDNTVTVDTLVIREDVVQRVFESTGAQKNPVMSVAES